MISRKKTFVLSKETLKVFFFKQLISGMRYSEMLKKEYNEIVAFGQPIFF